MNTGNARVTVLLTAVLLGAAGCSPGGGTAASPTGTAPPGSASASASMAMGTAAPGGSAAAASGTGSNSTAAITIRDFAYGQPLEVAAGATVTVTNMDSAAHTVTADDGAAFDVGIKGSGGTATFRAPAAPGTYAYHCTYHPNMHGTLTVK